jgi:hypothetical protein
MREGSVLSGTASNHSALAKRIHQIFATDGERAMRLVTHVLIKTLREGNQDIPEEVFRSAGSLPIHGSKQYNGLALS